ncbi:MAG: hypothetical protein AAF204_02270 [Pseudomonadota bacterium]
MNKPNLKEYAMRASETGSALVYILIAIALLAALTVSFMEPSSQQTSSQNTFRTTAALQGQIDTIRSAIQECVLIYPNGDPTINTAPVGSDPNPNTRYPINPDSTHYTSATPGRSGDRLVRNMRCPGNITTANAYDHALVFTGASGKFLRPAPDLFGDWQIYNGEDGVFYWTETDKTDAFVVSALEKLDEKFSECEADVIDTSVAPAGAKDLDSNSLLTCPANNLCFRVWVIQNGTAVFNGDANTDETSC